MSTPQRVREAAAATDERIRSMAAQAQGIADDGDSAGNDDAEAQPIQATQPPVQPDDDDAGTAAPDMAAQLAALQAEVAKSEQRYRSLDGMFRAANKQIEDYRDLIGNLNTAKPEAPAAEPPAPAGHTQSDVDSFGEDLIQLMQRIARQVARVEVAELRKTVEGVQGQVQGVSKQTAMTAKESFDNKLDQLSPGWRKLDSDDDFIAWLQNSQVVQQVFAAGVEQLDATAVSGVFNMYSQITGQSVQQKQDMANTKGDKLARQVAPGKSKSSPPPIARKPEERIWARSEIVDFYKNGRKKYSQDEYAAIEREIAAAQQNHRVDHNL
jgi:hypothetical protein